MAHNHLEHSLTSLDGRQFAGLIRAGYARLKQKSGIVNGLNIFPVPDGDTGTNMMLSLGSGIDALNRQCTVDTGLGPAAAALTSGLMMGARGNSGVILSQLFRGFQKAVQHESAMDVIMLAKALHEGVQIAYRAVAKPVEGTILTVAREAALVGIRESKRTSDMAVWMEKVLDAANAALQETPNQLEVLRQAGVVDSGGQGLVFIYEGFLRFLLGQPAIDEGADASADNEIQIAFSTTAAHHDDEYGYCTEVLIRATEDADLAAGRLREELGRYGDSLLVVANDNLLKAHVHTLHPGRVLEDALQYGPLIKIKIDNMTEQNQALMHSEADQTSNRIETTAKEQSTPLSVVAVAAGEGLCALFKSLGVDVIITGGQTMNPSTEEIVNAVRQTNSQSCILLPNNKNIVLSAEQAREVVGPELTVIPSMSIPAGIAAMMAYLPNKPMAENVDRMTAALAHVRAGQVVRAVRDAVYQERSIEAGQFLGLVSSELVMVAGERPTAALAVIQELVCEDSEILTVFHGADVQPDELAALRKAVIDEYGIEVETQFGGQPIYDYIFSVE